MFQRTAVSIQRVDFLNVDMSFPPSQSFSEEIYS